MTPDESLTDDERGTPVVEFALLMPLLAALLYGMLAYGQYFLLAHSIQELANDAARSTVGGLDTGERRALALSTVNAELPRLNSMPANRITTQFDESAGIVTISVRLDASNIGIFRTPLVPLPGTLIERRAVIRAGGVS